MIRFGGHKSYITLWKQDTLILVFLFYIITIKKSYSFYFLLSWRQPALWVIDRFPIWKTTFYYSRGRFYKKKEISLIEFNTIYDPFFQWFSKKIFMPKCHIIHLVIFEGFCVSFSRFFESRPKLIRKFAGRYDFSDKRNCIIHLMNCIFIINLVFYVFFWDVFDGGCWKSTVRSLSVRTVCENVANRNFGGYFRVFRAA